MNFTVIRTFRIIIVVLKILMAAKVANVDLRD